MSKSAVLEAARGSSPAEVDDGFAIMPSGKLEGVGGIANRLLTANMDPRVLRTNDTLRDDEWKMFDKVVVDICRSRMVGIQDLVSRGLVYNIPNGMAVTVLQYQNQSDMSAAQVSMSGLTRGLNDRLDFGIGYLPLPIIHKDFQIDARTLAMSRRYGLPLDTTMASVAALKISEMAEDILFNGYNSFAYGGGTIYGYLDYNLGQTGTIAGWGDSGSVGANILTQIRAMKQKMITAKRFGPWIVYVPTAYESVLDADYSATTGTTLTIRERILKITGIVDVKVADRMTAGHVIMVELQASTVRMVIGMQPTNLQWDTEGGMGLNFKVMAIMVPQLRADQDNNCGIVDYSA
jgi:uncharacterized linocin/CFP29 family protein